MPLERLSDRSFISEPNGIRFGMKKGEQTVLCVLTREALAEVFKCPDEAQWESVFATNRAVIEAVASELYETGAAPGPVHISSRDLDPNRFIASAVGALNRSSNHSRASDDENSSM